MWHQLNEIVSYFCRRRTVILGGLSWLNIYTYKCGSDSGRKYLESINLSRNSCTIQKYSMSLRPREIVKREETREMANETGNRLSTCWLGSS